MTEPRTFKRERFAVGALIVSTAVLCVVGALSQFLTFSGEVRGVATFVLVMAFAALCGFSLWVANVAAGCAQILAKHRKEYPVAFAIALFTAGLTGLVSVIGVDLAWMTLTDQHQSFPETKYIVGAGFALGFVKVAMGFVIEACQQIETGAERSHDALLESRDRRIRDLEAEVRNLASQIKKPLPDKAEAPSQTVNRGVSRRGVRQLSRAISQSPMRASANDPTPITRQLRERAPPLSEADVRDTIAEMTRAGEVINFSTVAKRRNVPYSRVERSPGRPLIEAVIRANAA